MRGSPPVVERWTGIPTTRMLEGERDKPAAYRGRNRTARGVPAGGDLRGCERGQEGKGRIERSGAAPRFVHVSWAPPASAKTELAKALAEFLFDDESALVRDRHVEIHGEALRVAADRWHRRAMSATRREAPSPRQSGAGPTRSCCSTRSKKGTSGGVQCAPAGPWTTAS